MASFFSNMIQQLLHGHDGLPDNYPDDRVPKSVMEKFNRSAFKEVQVQEKVDGRRYTREERRNAVFESIKSKMADYRKLHSLDGL